MTVLIDEDGCIACGQCMDICPEVFKPRPDGKAYAAVEDLPAEVQNRVVEAQESCPVSVIEVV